MDNENYEYYLNCYESTIDGLKGSSEVLSSLRRITKCDSLMGAHFDTLRLYLENLIHDTDRTKVTFVSSNTELE
jgi:hypothetical protein